MKRQQRGFGTIVLAALAVLAGVLIVGSLFKLALAVGAVFVAWKLMFDQEPVRVPAKPAARVETLAPLASLSMAEHEPDPELARLDRELEKAIAAAGSR